MWLWAIVLIFLVTLVLASAREQARIERLMNAYAGGENDDDGSTTGTSSSDRASGSGGVLYP